KSSTRSPQTRGRPRDMNDVLVSNLVQYTERRERIAGNARAVKVARSSGIRGADRWLAIEPWRQGAPQLSSGGFISTVNGMHAGINAVTGTNPAARRVSLRGTS